MLISTKRRVESNEEEQPVPKRIKAIIERSGLNKLLFDLWCMVLTYLNPWDHAPFLLVLTTKLWPRAGVYETARERWINALLRPDARQVRLCGRFFHTKTSGPSRVERDGTSLWKIGDSLHRGNDLPAVVSSAKKEWWFCNNLHREDDKPARVFGDGTEMWFFTAYATVQTTNRR